MEDATDFGKTGRASHQATGYEMNRFERDCTRHRGDRSAAWRRLAYAARKGLAASALDAAMLLSDRKRNDRHHNWKHHDWKHHDWQNYDYYDRHDGIQQQYDQHIDGNHDRDYHDWERHDWEQKWEKHDREHDWHDWEHDWERRDWEQHRDHADGNQHDSEQHDPNQNDGGLLSACAAAFWPARPPGRWDPASILLNELIVHVPQVICTGSSESASYTDRQKEERKYGVTTPCTTKAFYTEKIEDKEGEKKEDEELIEEGEQPIVEEMMDVIEEVMDVTQANETDKTEKDQPDKHKRKEYKAPHKGMTETVIQEETVIEEGEDLIEEGEDQEKEGEELIEEGEKLIEEGEELTEEGEEPEKRECGIMIACRTKESYTQKWHYTVIDVPGHRDFIKNMIMGASQEDVALIIVPADGNITTTIAKSNHKAGEIQGNRKAGEIQGKTRQHSRLINLLGMKQICIGMDYDTAGYTQHPLAETANEMQSMLVKAGRKQGFVDKGTLLMPISGQMGDILLRKYDHTPWIQGCDVEYGKEAIYMDTAHNVFDVTRRVPERPTRAPLRRPTSGIYRIEGVGEALVGRVEQGAVQPGEEVTFLPTHTASNQHIGQMSTVEMHHQRIDFANLGDHVGLHVKGLGQLNMPGSRDVMVYKKDTTLGQTKEFETQIQALDTPYEFWAGYLPIGSVSCGREACRIRQPQRQMSQETGGHQTEVSQSKYVEQIGQASKEEEIVLDEEPCEAEADDGKAMREDDGVVKDADVMMTEEELMELMEFRELMEDVEASMEHGTHVDGMEEMTMTVRPCSTLQHHNHTWPKSGAADDDDDAAVVVVVNDPGVDQTNHCDDHQSTPPPAPETTDVAPFCPRTPSRPQRPWLPSLAALLQRPAVHAPSTLLAHTLPTTTPATTSPAARELGHRLHGSEERDRSHQQPTDAAAMPTPQPRQRDHQQHSSTSRHNPHQSAATPARNTTGPPATPGAVAEPSKKAQREAHKRAARKAARASIAPSGDHSCDHQQRHHPQGATRATVCPDATGASDPAAPHYERASRL